MELNESESNLFTRFCLAISTLIIQIIMNTKTAEYKEMKLSFLSILFFSSHNVFVRSVNFLNTLVKMILFLPHSLPVWKKFQQKISSTKLPKKKICTRFSVLKSSSFLFLFSLLWSYLLLLTLVWFYILFWLIL